VRGGPGSGPDSSGQRRAGAVSAVTLDPTHQRHNDAFRTPQSHPGVIQAPSGPARGGDERLLCLLEQCRSRLE